MIAVKLASLHLQAFGPFTDKVIYFAAHGANLHLVYGPNEAGKSSALRAMTDLRFGIPTRSTDNFLHAHDGMRIAGLFVDRQGHRMGFVRRKGRAPTLSRFDPAAGGKDALQPASAVDEQTLTGGLDRGAFESMFGLDHGRLRKGGELLLEGQGELGAALFEASAGTQGIGRLLAAIDDDAKAYFNPHGRTTTATINEARRTLDEARKALRDALTRPADWRTLHDAHVAALSRLTDASQALETLRRRDHELTELRACEPTLRDYYRESTELALLVDAPMLRETAREDRQAAQQTLERANSAAREAALTADRLTQVLAQLFVEDNLLSHGATIERVANLIDASARDRQGVLKAKDLASRIEAELSLLVRRLVPDGDLQSALAAVPSAADRVALDQHLAALASQTERSHEPRQRAADLREALALSGQSAIPQAEPAARHALQAAVRRGKALGDVGRQVAEVEREIKLHESALQRLLAALHADDVARLIAAQPLLDAQFQQMRQAIAEMAAAMLKERNELANLIKDLEEQRLQLRALQATGEVVTAATLRAARSNRDAAWLAIRHAYIKGNWSPAGRLIAAFEAAQSEADRQADLLRTDADRAARLALTEGRIGQMAARQAILERSLGELDARRLSVEQNWNTLLAKNGLPAFDLETLREWQLRRVEALQVAEQLTAAQAKLRQILNAVTEAADEMDACLRTVGAKYAESRTRDATDRLLRAIEQAEQWEHNAGKAEADNIARVTIAEQQRAELARAETLVAAADVAITKHHDALQAWCGRLFLAANASPASIRAQLDELEAIARKSEQMTRAQSDERELRADIEDLERQVRGLAELIGEPAPLLVEDFADRLRARLELARKAERERENLTRDHARAQSEQRAAAEQRSVCEATLTLLCEEAGGVAMAELPDCELRADCKRALAKSSTRLHQQLMAASSGKVAVLRERLAGLDIVSMDAERERLHAKIAVEEAGVAAARQVEERTRRALEAIDNSDRAATLRESIEAAAARLRRAMRPWARLRLAHALLREALNRFRERAQAPMIAAASTYFSLMTGGAFTRLVTDDVGDKPVLRAERAGAAIIGMEAMSEGTRDQLYLALRLAALALRRDSHPDMPLVLDDVLITSDDERATHILRALDHFAADSQVVILTHHRHLIEVAQAALPGRACAIHML